MAEPRLNVPFLDVGAAYQELRVEIDRAHRRVMESGWYVLGSELASFEREFAAYSGATGCVGVANGLDALTLALRAVGVGPKDEVIVPSNTYIATWLAVSSVGATPVPVDPDPATHNITAAAIEAAISPRTRAILPVHLYGQPTDMSPILALALSLDIRVISDAAQAHGAKYEGQPVGALGDVVCWSFYPGKNLGAFGDGGAITTNSAEIAERVTLLRNYGSSAKYVHDVRGVNSRLDELHAAALRVKLRSLDAWNARRSTIAARYSEAFSEIDGLEIPKPPHNIESSWHLYVVQHAKRDQLQSRLAEAGVQTLVHYPIPPHMQQAYTGLRIHGPLPVAERLAERVLSLPIGPHASDLEIERVIDATSSISRELIK